MNNILLQRAPCVRPFSLASAVAAATIWCCGPAQANAQTVISGGEVGGQTWTMAGSPFRLTGDITIAAGTTLRIESGVQVTVLHGDAQAAGFDPAAVEITVRGSLIAEGVTISSECTGFNSIQCNSWHGIVVEPQATHVSIAGSFVRGGYAGIRYRHPGSILNTAGATFDNLASNTLNGATTHGSGIRVESGTPLVERASFAYNASGVMVTGSGRPVIRSSVFGTGSIPAITIEQTDATAAPVRILNNDLGQFTSGTSTIGINPSVSGLHVEIANNRFVQSVYPVMSITANPATSSVNIRHNLFENLAKAVSGATLGSANIEGTGAAGIDMGANDVDVPADRNGHPRPQGVAMDIGAYESTGATNRLSGSWSGSWGRVSSSPAGISLVDAPVHADFAAGTVVTLTPNVPSGSRFHHWSGACTGHGICQVTMDSWKSVDAVFVDAHATRGDADGDFRADLFWREPAPGVGLSWWTMNGSTATGYNYHQVPAEWQIADVGDVDGDGKTDLLWRRAVDGATYLWLLDGLGFKSFHDLGILDPAVWSLVGLADLDGDGKSDLVWRSSSGLFYFWLMNGGTIAAQGGLPNPVGAQWQVAGMADMDRDGKADIVFRDAVTGEVYLWFMNGLAIASQSSVGFVDPAVWSLVDAADFDSDGMADLLWRSSAGEVYVWLMNGATPVDSGFLANNPGMDWSIHAVSDFDGDNRADLVWRHANGTPYFWGVSGLAVPVHGALPNPGGTWQVVAP